VKRRISISLAAALSFGLALPAPESRAADPEASSGAAVSPKEATAEAAIAPAPDASTEQSVSMFPIKGDQPLSIRSDELEAIEEGGRRRLLFTRNVNIEQGDLRVHSDRLEALYPPGGNQPDKLIANGHVKVVQRDKTMLCDAATYYQTQDRLVCTGNAELQQGTDRVRGKEIEIFPKLNRVKVKGGAVVNVAGDSGKAAPPVSAGAAKAKAKP
jgi:lipopolysaccharide export system protein LptA